MRRLATPATLLATLALAACGPAPANGPSVVGATRATLDPGKRLPLSTKGDRIVDAEGRQVILRGLEHHALQDVDYGGRAVKDGDYARIASWGFTVLRMAISWSRIEPTQGQYDEAYLADVKHAMDLAHAAGLSVILEWHQDLWGRCAVAKTSSLARSANGAPDWTCPATYTPSDLGYGTLFDDLWQNTGGLEDAFVQAWTHVLSVLGDHPALAGIDLVNEPSGSGNETAYLKDEIYPGYRKLVPLLRAAGAKGLVLLDAPGLRNESQSMYTEDLSGIGPDLVFAPHLYTDWFLLYGLGERVPDAEKTSDFAAAAKQATALGLPLFDGEWGVNLNLKGALDDMKTHVGLEDQYRIGSSYWSFSAPDPGAPATDPDSGAQALLNVDHSVRTDVLDVLSRPYPMATPGTLTKVAWDFGRQSLAVELDADPSITAPLVLYTPARSFGGFYCVTVTGDPKATYDTRTNPERVLVHFSTGGPKTVTVGACKRL